MNDITSWGYTSPPTTRGGEDDLRAAWEACPANCSPIVMGDLNINVEHPVTNGRRHSPTCWTKSTWLIRPANSIFGSAASRRLGNAGLGARSIMGSGYTPSQITSWPEGIGSRGSGRLASDLRRSMTLITARLSLTYGKGEMGPSRPIDETANGSPSRSPPGSKTK